MKKIVLTAVLTALAATVNAQTFPRQISIQGSAKIVAASTQAFVTAGAVTTGKTAKDANDRNATIMTAVLTGLKEIGIDAKDIVSSDISLRPVIEYTPRNIPKVVGYDATHLLSITFKDIGKLGDGLDKIVAAGANSIGDVQLSAPQSDSKLEEARIAAVKDARQKAEVLVNAAGGKVGKVITITLQNYNAPRSVRSMAADTMMKTAAMPIATGDLTGDINVTVTFEIID